VEKESELKRDGLFLPKLRDNGLISALIVEYQEFQWLVIQVVEERCHISDHIK